MTKRGQSIIEYTLIAILVILGIVFMGPYVLRSINAYFRLWDSGVQDSFEETLQQAPVNDVPDIAGNCTYTPVKEGCGMSHAGASCGSGYSAWTLTDTPQGCSGAPKTWCQHDCGCCDAEPQGCGDFPLQTDASGHVLAPADNIPPPGPNNCYYGQHLLASVCTSCAIDSSDPNCCPNLPAPVCINDPGCSPPACTGSFPSAGFKECPATKTDLTKSLPFTWIKGDGTLVHPANVCSSATTKCQYICADGFFPNENCSYEYIVAPSIGSACPAADTCPCTCSSGPPWTCTNNCSFSSACTPPGLNEIIIAPACSLNASNGVSCSNPGSGCGDPYPAGIPGQSCILQLTYSIQS